MKAAIALLLAVAAIPAFAASDTPACETAKIGAVEVADAWSRASIGTSRPGVLYLTMRNTGSENDALIEIASPAAAMPMLHETVVKDGVASMPHALEVPVPAGATVALEPGGFHGMLMKLAQPLKEGERFPVTLQFREAGKVTIQVRVLGIGAKAAGCSDQPG